MDDKGACSTWPGAGLGPTIGEDQSVGGPYVRGVEKGEEGC